MKKSNFILTLTASLIAAASLHAQAVTVDKSQLTFSAPVGTTIPATQTVTVSSAVSGSTFTAVSNATWLKLTDARNPTPQTGLASSVPDIIAVTADPTNLPANSYSGIISFTGGASVSVTFNVGTISVSPATAALGSYQAGSTNYPSSVTLNVSGAPNGFTISKAPADTWYTGAILGNPPNAVIVQFNVAAASGLTAGTTYNGTLTITPTGSGNNIPVNVPVTLTVTASPQVTVSPSALAFNWQAGGTNNQPQQTLQLTSNASVPLSYSITTSGATWITPPTGGFIQPGGTPVTIGVNGAGQPPSTTPYTGFVAITLSSGLFSNGQPSINIPIQLTVSNFPLLNVTPSSLAFNYQFGSGPANFPQPLSVTPTSTGAPNPPLQYTVSAISTGNWLTGPAGLLVSGTPISVSVNPGTLTPNTYNGSIVLTPVANGSGQQQVTIPVTLAITNTPALVLSTSEVDFFYQVGQAPPGPQTVSVTSSNGGPLSYSVTGPGSAAAPWLQLGGTLSGITDQTSFSVGVTSPGSVASDTVFTALLTITASDPVTGAIVGTSQTINVKFFVSNNPVLVGSPNAPIVLSTLQNSQSPPVTISLTSSNPAAGQLTITNVQFSVPWLSSTQSPAATPGSFTISAVPGNTMTPGTYFGTIVVAATGPGGAAVVDSPYTIHVTMQLNATTGTVNPSSLNFTAQSGGAAASPQTLSINTNGVPLAYSAVANDAGIGWLTVTNGAGTTNGTVSVSVNASKLTTGTYFGAVYVNVPNAAGSPFRIPVTFNVTTGTPGTISATPTTTLTFQQAAGGTAPATQQINVTGTSGVTFSVVTDSTWLSAVVGTGTSSTGAVPATVNVSVNAGAGSSALPIGTYHGNVTITAPGASGSPITIPVVLNVVAAQTLAFTSTTPLNFTYTIGAPLTGLSQAVGVTSTGSVLFTASANTVNNGTWLSVSPTSGTATGTPTTLTVSVNPTGLVAGNYSGNIAVSSSSAGASLTLTVNLTVSAVAPPVLVAIKNSASYTTGAVAPGELVLVGGTNVGPSTLTYGTVVAANNTLSTTVNGTQVFFDNTAAPIYYATATQTAVFVPYEIAGRPSTVVTVVSQGGTSNALTYNVVPTQPGIFTQNSQGSGPGSILNQDNSTNGPNNGAAAGSVIQIFMTGEGQTNPGGVTGAIAPTNGSGLKLPVQVVTATIGGLALSGNAVAYAGSAPGDVNGVFQVDLVVPAGLTPGPQPIIVTVGSVSSQAGVTVQVK